MLNYSKYPNQDNVDGVERYIEHGIEPGDFLQAVICNDLKEACVRADRTNQRLFFEIVFWFYNEAPEPCSGSAEKYRAWLERFRKGEDDDGA